MAGRERGRVVQKEQLREPTRLEQRTAQPSPELELARDPALSVVAPADPPALVVQAAAVPVDETTCRICDKVAERRHAVCSGISPRGLGVCGARLRHEHPCPHREPRRRRRDERPLAPPTLSANPAASGATSAAAAHMTFIKPAIGVASDSRGVRARASE